MNKNRSAAMKACWSNPSYRRKLLASRRRVNGSAGYRKRMSSLKLEFWHKNEDLRKEYSKRRKGVKVSKETCKKLSKARLEYFERFPEGRRIISKARKQYFVDHPEILKKLALEAPTKFLNGRQPVPNRKELYLEKILDKVFPKEFKLNVLGGRTIGGKIPDFIHTKRKVLLEHFGNHWHGKEITGRSKKEEERVRRMHFSEYGYRTIIVWEEDLKDKEGLIKKIKTQGGFK